MDTQEFLGLDIGDKRIGIARGSSLAGIAQPLAVVAADQASSELKKLITEHKPAGIVVGLPRNLNGDDTKQTAKIRAWVDGAKKSFSPTFYWQDESLTSYEAINKHGAKAGEVDAVAAAVLLQDFLESLETERVVC